MPIDHGLVEKALANYMESFSPGSAIVADTFSIRQLENIACRMNDIINHYGNMIGNHPSVIAFKTAYLAKDYVNAVKAIVCISPDDLKSMVGGMLGFPSPENTLECYFKYLRSKKGKDCRRSVIANFVSDLQLNVCPYCNRNFVNQKGGVEIDHYFCKSKYPLFTLSFYNMIPCCHSCNHSKGSENLAPSYLPSPYEIEMSALPVHFKAILDDSSGHVCVDTIFSDADFDKGYNDSLGLKDTYNLDEAYILDMIEKIRLSRSAYPELLSESLTSTTSRASDVIRLLLGRNIGRPPNNLYPYYRLDNDLYEEFVLLTSCTNVSIVSR